MKKTLIFLISLAIGFWAIYFFKVHQREERKTHLEEQKEQRIQDSIYKINDIESKKQAERELRIKEREEKAKMKAMVEEYGYKVTLEMMNKVCPNSGKMSSHQVLNYYYNKQTKTLSIEVYSNWMGKSSLFDDDEKHEVTTKTTLFGNDNKTYIEITNENEAFKVSKQNKDIQNLASQSLDISLELLNKYQEVFKN